MIEIIEKLQMYFRYEFVVNALIVGILIAFCSSLFGATLVLKRFSYIGDGLSHVAFGAMAVATVFNIANDMPIVLGITIVTAILLLKTGEKTKIQGDAAIGMLSVGSMAVGYLVLNLFGTSTNLAGDVCSTLFGTTAILTLKSSEVTMCWILTIFVSCFFWLFYNKIFGITFDESFCRASGIKVDHYNAMLAVVIAIIIVLAMNLVGSLLISALVIMPALSAMAVFKSYRAVTLCSIILSVLCTTTGLFISLLVGTPVGATIVSVDLAGFILFSIIGKIFCSR